VGEFILQSLLMPDGWTVLVLYIDCCQYGFTALKTIFAYPKERDLVAD
jgi:hypothetical protein